MAGHAQLKFVMTECSKTQIRLTGLMCLLNKHSLFCGILPVKIVFFCVKASIFIWNFFKKQIDRLACLSKYLNLYTVKKYIKDWDL